MRLLGEGCCASWLVYSGAFARAYIRCPWAGSPAQPFKVCLHCAASGGGATVARGSADPPGRALLFTLPTPHTRHTRSALNKAIAYVAARKQISAIRKAVRESMDSMDEADASPAAEPAPAPEPVAAKARRKAVGGAKAAGAKAPGTRGRRSGGASRELVARANKAEASG